jgi:hypothetical protein
LRTFDMRMNYRILMAVCLLAIATPAAAQRNQVTIDASVIRGTVGYARAIKPKTYAGIEIGFGFPQIDRTFSPSPDSTGSPDFEEYLHVGVFVRVAPSANFEVDAGIRAAIADLWSCGASDCWPAPFVGAYVQPMAGWQKFKVGPRLVAGWINETEAGLNNEGGTGVVALNPFTARLTLPW